MWARGDREYKIERKQWFPSIIRLPPLAFQTLITSGNDVVKYVNKLMHFLISR